MQKENNNQLNKGCHSRVSLSGIPTTFNDAQGGDPRLQLSGMTVHFNHSPHLSPYYNLRGRLLQDIFPLMGKPLILMHPLPGERVRCVSTGVRGIFKEEALNKNTFRAPLRSGFTLIELLVVVLIIGILAAVALPQYQRAVIKTHFTKLKIYTDSLLKAQMLYHLANGQYSTKIDDLDIQLPPSTNPAENNARRYSWGACYLRTNPESVYCEDRIIGIRYEIQYDGSRSCLAYNDDLNSPQNRLCQAETGKKNYHHQEHGSSPYTSWVY